MPSQLLLSISFLSGLLVSYQVAAILKTFLVFFSGSILLTWPNHCSLFFSIPSKKGLTWSSSLIFTLLILSLLVTPLISLNTCISAACNLVSVFVVNDQFSDPYNSIGFRIDVDTIALHSCGISLSFSKCRSISYNIAYCLWKVCSIGLQIGHGWNYCFWPYQILCPSFVLHQMNVVT